MQNNNFKFAKTIYELGKQFVVQKGKHSINKDLFPPYLYTERKELVEGQGKVFVTDNERRIADMNERGHIYTPVNDRAKLVINRNLPILNSIKSVAELTQNKEMLENYQNCAENCEQIVIAKIAEIISKGNTNFSEELYPSEILRAWKDSKQEEIEVSALLDEQTSNLCKTIKEDYTASYEQLSQMYPTDELTRQFNKLVAPEDIKQKAIETEEVLSTSNENEDSALEA